MAGERVGLLGAARGVLRQQQLVEAGHDPGVGEVDPDARIGAAQHVRGHERGLGVRLFEILVDDRRFEDDIVAALEHRHLAVGRHFLEPARLVAEIDLGVLEVETLLEQREVGALGEGTDLGGDEGQLGHGFGSPFRVAQADAASRERSACARAPMWPMTSAAARPPSRAHSARPRPRVRPWRKPAA